MAEPYYVDSNRTGGNNTGDSWADAYLLLETALALTVAGDFVYVDDGHSESTAESKTYTISGGTTANPVRVICCVTDSLTPVSVPSAQLLTTTANDNLSFYGYCFFYGFIFIGYANVKMGLANNLLIFEKCKFVVKQESTGGISTSNDGVKCTLIDCDLEDIVFLPGKGLALQVINGTYIDGTRVESRDALVIAALEGGSILIDGGDYSDVGYGNWLNIASMDMDTRVDIRNVRAPSSGLTLTTGTPPSSSFEISVHACDNEDGYHRIQQGDNFGQHSEETVIKRTGGATYDGTLGYSLCVISSANTKEYISPYRFKLSARVVDISTQKTIKVHIAYDDPLLYNDDIWIELKYHDATNKGHGKWVRTKMANVLATPDRTAFTDVSGSETWGGTAQDNEETIEMDVTGSEGLVEVWVCLAKPSTTVYIDPKFEVS